MEDALDLLERVRLCSPDESKDKLASQVEIPLARDSDPGRLVVQVGRDVVLIDPFSAEQYPAIAPVDEPLRIHAGGFAGGDPLA